MKSILRSTAILIACAVPARAADVILNEYNAVSDTQVLQNGASDPFWGIVPGNGGDWFELVVITDHLDMRGWTFTLTDSSGGGAQVLALTQHEVWADLRSGTIITVSEDLSANVDDYQPVLGKWWLNVRANAATDGTYITAANFFANNDNWQITIKDQFNTVRFGPAGEGIRPTSGVGNNEVCKLEADPSPSITPLSAYNDGASSTFGLPNTWSGGAATQSFSVLRSVVPFSQLTTVVINEVLTHTDPPQEDFIELYNMTPDPIDISGWYLSDSLNDLQMYEIPDGTIVPGNGYLVLYQSQFGFGLNSATGDDVVLSVADSNGVLTGGRDYIKFGAIENGVSFGRYPNGTGPVYQLESVTEGAANSEPRIGPVVINEIMYHPPDLTPGVDNIDHEFIELHNFSDAPVDLYTFFPDPGEIHAWRISDGVNYTFPIGTTVPPRGFLLVVSFDPIAEPAKLADFRMNYGLDESVAIVGPYTGQLSNGGETVSIAKPDTPQAPPEVFVPYVIVDSLSYLDRLPWPPPADGIGYSLERIVPDSLPDMPANWEASALVKGTPGCPNDQENPLAGDINGDGSVDAADVAFFVEILLGKSGGFCTTVRADVTPDGLFNGEDIQPYVDAVLGG